MNAKETEVQVREHCKMMKHFIEAHNYGSIPLMIMHHLNTILSLPDQTIYQLEIITTNHFKIYNERVVIEYSENLEKRVSKVNLTYLTNAPNH